jgi:hypothetical protein
LRIRGFTDRLTFPLARRAVAAALLVQVVARPGGVAFASPSPSVPVILDSTAGRESATTMFAESDSADSTSTNAFTATHVVKRGDTLWSIAERFYGAGEEFDRIVDANVGRLMDDGRRFEKAGLIYPGWSLAVPLAREHENGVHWYVVRRGDTLRGVAAQLFGDEERYSDLFALNVGEARVGDSGPVLRDPDLIWPGLRLRLLESSPEEAPPPEEPMATPEPVTIDRIRRSRLRFPSPPLPSHPFQSMRLIQYP